MTELWTVLAPILLGDMLNPVLFAFLICATGSWSFAHLFFDDPTALEKFLVSLIVTHLLVGLIAAIAWELLRQEKKKA